MNRKSRFRIFIIASALVAGRAFSFRGGIRLHSCARPPHFLNMRSCDYASTSREIGNHTPNGLGLFYFSNRYPLSTPYFLDSWGSQHWKERTKTGAGLGQPGKSYHAVPTGEFNWRTSGNPCVIAFIEAPLKSRVWRSKFVIFHTCPIFFWKFLVALCRAGGPGPCAPCV